MALQSESRARIPMSDLRRIPFLVLLALGLALGVMRIHGPSEDLYPLEGDAAKYHQIAKGFARLYSDPVSSLRLWITRSAGPEDLARHGFDSWVLQHAPAYTSLLGVAYLLPGDDVAAGRFYNSLLLSLCAGLLFLLGCELFGFWQGIAAGALVLVWAPNWFYGPAILTEVPIGFAAVLASFLLLRTRRSTRWRGWVLGGAGIGFLVLSKTPLRFVAIPWILLELLLDRDAGDRRFLLRRAAGRIAGWGGLQILWLAFLWGFHLSPNPLSGMGDDWMWVYRGNYVPDRGWESVGVGDAITPELVAGARAAEGAPESARKGTMYKAAFLETARRHPGGLAALVTAKAGIFWTYPAAKTFVRAGPFSLPPPVKVQPALAVAALLGLALCATGAGGWRLVPAVFPLFLMTLHAATHLVSRYNLPGIPFAMLYGAGGIGGAVVGARRLIAARALPSHGTRIDAGVAAAGLLAAALLLRTESRGLVLLAPIAAAVALVRLAARAFGGSRAGFLRAGIVLAPLAILATGTLANDPDPDERSVRLRRQGEGVRLVLRLPAGVDPASFASADVLLDLLPSTRGTMEASVRLNGEEIARFGPRPPASAESFLLDAKTLPDRYTRVERSVARHLDGFVRRHRSLARAGYDQYRQWYRVPIEPARVFGSNGQAGEAVLEIVLLASRGGHLDVFLDSKAAAAGGPQGRVVSMPAFFENPFELSNYRFDALCSSRRLADARLIRPARIYSERVRAERIAGGSGRPLAGEPRMRIRGQLIGGYGLLDHGGTLAPAWVPDLGVARRVLDPPEIARLQAERDWYDGGRVTF